MKIYIYFLLNRSKRFHLPAHFYLLIYIYISFFSTLISFVRLSGIPRGSKSFLRRLPKEFNYVALVAIADPLSL